MAQAPKPISEQWNGCLPNGRSFIAERLYGKSGDDTEKITRQTARSVGQAMRCSGGEGDYN
jgi:hypothetical protein